MFLVLRIVNLFIKTINPCKKKKKKKSPQKTTMHKIFVKSFHFNFKPFKSQKMTFASKKNIHIYLILKNFVTVENNLM